MKERIKQVTASMLFNLEGLRETSFGKATLAKIRRSVGKERSESIEIWPFVYGYLPEDLIGTDAETAILTAIQLFALHQQGKEFSVLYRKDDHEKFHRHSIGSALKILRTEEGVASIDRRFNIMITASTFDEFIYHLRHLITLLKSKEKEAKVDYPQLAYDLYLFLRGYGEEVRLSWAREYYKGNVKGEKSNER